MKAAVSIPDDLFDEAERLAEELRMTRSGLYARAIREYVASHDPDRVTAALNEVVDQTSDEDLAVIRAASTHALREVEW